MDNSEQNVRPLVRAAREQQMMGVADLMEHEAISGTRRRVAIQSAGLVGFGAIIAVLLDAFAVVGGIATGNGAAILGASRWIRNWEDDHGLRLLREPRWRWGRGRGRVDPQDFYAERPSR